MKMWYVGDVLDTNLREKMETYSSVQLCAGLDVLKVSAVMWFVNSLCFFKDLLFFAFEVYANNFGPCYVCLNLCVCACLCIYTYTEKFEQVLCS